MGSTGRDTEGMREGEASATPLPSADAIAREQTTASMGLWPWVRLATSGNLTVEQFCELAGLEVSALRDVGQRFSQPVANRIAELVFGRFGESTAMQAALTLEPGHFNLLELIARSAANVGAGLEQCCRFFPLLHDGGRMTFARLETGEVEVRWRPPSSYEVHHGYVELTFAVAVLAIRRETGQEALAPARVHFRHAAPADNAVHARVFGVEPRFGAATDELVFDGSAAALPLTRGNPEVHAAAVKSGAELIDD